MHPTHTRLAALAGIVAVIAFLHWTADHDKKVSEAAEKYEECIYQEYGVSPAQYRIEQGVYPECNSL